MATRKKKTSDSKKNTKPTKTWWDRIDAAEKRGRFTRDDQLLAENWVTCACGEQSEFIERDDYGEPRDYKLAQLGLTFSTAVGLDQGSFGKREKGNPKRARRILTEIEARASKLLVEELERAEKRAEDIKKLLNFSDDKIR